MTDATRVRPKTYNGQVRTSEGNFAYWTSPGNWAAELFGKTDEEKKHIHERLSNLGLALGMRQEGENLGDHKTYKDRKTAWKDVFKQKAPVYVERQPERQPRQNQAGETFPKIDAETARRYILDEIDAEDHTYDLKRMEGVAKERSYRLDYSRSMDDLGGHPERIYADRKVIYIANDIGGPGTWAALIAHALGHDSLGARETDAQSHAASLTAELYGADHPITAASRRLMPYM